MTEPELMTAEDGSTATGYECPECGRLFTTAAGRGTHRQQAHGVPGRDSHRKRTRGRPRERRRVESSPNGSPPPEPAPIAAPPAGADLRQAERELAEGIGTIGSLIAAGLSWYKQTRTLALASSEPVSLPLVGDPRKLPALESTLGHVVALRAPLSARVLMRYAAENPTLLRWVLRFNTAMRGGETGGLVIDHAAGLLHTVRPDNTLAAGALAMRAPDALGRVMAENIEIDEHWERVRREGGPAPAGAPKDERGAGD